MYKIAFLSQTETCVLNFQWKTSMLDEIKGELIDEESRYSTMS